MRNHLIHSIQKGINGYSELMVAAFVERGMHARSPVGMASLPFNLA